MMEISCEDPTYEFKDSQSVLFNASLYALIQEKKSNSIAYNSVTERSYKKEWRLVCISTHTHENLAKLFTKLLPA